MNRLKELREKRGMNMTEAAAALGYKYMTYVNYEKGARQLVSEQVAHIADFYGVTADYVLGRNIVYLRTELDEKYDRLDDAGKAVVDAVIDLELKRCVVPDIVDFGTIRKYLSRPAAGLGGLVEGEDYEDIPRTAETPREADFALVVSGDSMEPYIHDGETVFIDEKAELRDLDVGVFCVDGATYVKQYAPGINEYYLLSANPKREDANIIIRESGNQSVQYFGKVILPKKLPRPIYEA